jgi:hypothetical protein
MLKVIVRGRRIEKKNFADYPAYILICASLWELRALSVCNFAANNEQ